MTLTTIKQCHQMFTACVRDVPRGAAWGNCNAGEGFESWDVYINIVSKPSDKQRYREIISDHKVWF